MVFEDCKRNEDLWEEQSPCAARRYLPAEAVVYDSVLLYRF